MFSDEVKNHFWKRVDKTEYCWNYTGGITGLGYGAYWTDYVTYLAHRFSWVITKGDIPDKLLVLHKCDNRKCVNPDHLYLGTQSDNILDRSHRYKGFIGQISRFYEGEVWLMKRLHSKGIKHSIIEQMFKVSGRHLRKLIKDGCTKYRGDSYV
jgi:hypothetical protein